MKRKFLLIFIIAYSVIFCFLLYKYSKQERANEFSKFALVDKDEKKMSVYSYKGKLLSEFEIGLGTNTGNKIKNGDLRTPEGIFPIIDIQNSSNWDYDFGEGAIKGAYGPWFIRLRVSKRELFENSIEEPVFINGKKFKGIGIHGTHDNSTIGKRSSHGCIRMENQDLERFKKMIYLGMPVVIMPGIEDVMANRTNNIDTISYNK